jgi:hypothetical protein
MASNELKKIREIRNKILSLELAEMDAMSRRNIPEEKNAELAMIAADRAYQLDLLEHYECRYLIRKAESLGIEVPYKPEWYVMRVEDPKRPRETVEVKQQNLNNLGKAVINRQIREARRASVKWWIDVLIPVLALLVALAAIIEK